jgi:transposase
LTDCGIAFRSDASAWVRVCVVADRGMISVATIEGPEARNLEFILDARYTAAIVRKIVLENDDAFTPLLVEHKAGETQLFVKQVKIEGKRYIGCRNEAEAEKDRKDREAIVAALDAQLKKGDKALIGNSAYRRYLRKIGKAKDHGRSRSMLGSSPTKPVSTGFSCSGRMQK